MLTSLALATRDDHLRRRADRACRVLGAHRQPACPARCSRLSAAIPFALPFLIIGLALLQFSGIFAPQLQGSWPLLVACGYVAVTFPFVYWAIDGAMAAAGIERLNQAAATCGASRAQTIWRVIVPNIRPGLVGGAMLAFATVIGEFALVSVLASGIVHAARVAALTACAIAPRAQPGRSPP